MMIVVVVVVVMMIDDVDVRACVCVDGSMRA
jgi:hypothetical protein